MAGLSTYAQQKVLEHMVGKTSWTMPANVWVALYTATPSDAGGGTEVTGGSYARKQTVAANWGTASGTTISNAQLITFVTPTASWGTVGWFAIMDASTAGNQIGWAALTSSQAIGSGNTVEFAVAALTITLD
jgi:hypothetical protein